MKSKVAVVGDLVYDVLMWSCSRAYGVIVCRECYSDVGGSSNILITASRAGAEAHAVGCVGSDELGSLYKSILGVEGIDTRNIVSRGSTSIVTAFEVGGRVEYRVFVDKLLSRESLDIDWGLYDTVVLNGNTLADSSSEDLLEKIIWYSSRESKAILSTGVAARDSIDVLRGALEKGARSNNILLIANEFEAMNATGLDNPSRAAELLSKLSHTAIVTMGRRGCIVASRGSSVLITCEPVEAKPHQEVGAGDVFTAILAVLVGRYGFEELIEFARTACKAASEKVKRGLIGRRVLSREVLRDIVKQQLQL